MKRIQKQFIFTASVTPFECHASTIIKLSDGHFIAAWFGGSKEGNPDVAIWSAVCENNIWQQPKILSAETDTPHWNPVLFACGDGKISLFYKIGTPIADWKTMVMRSSDGGKSWSEAAELVPGDVSGGRGPVKNKPLLLPTGRILAPASTEQGRWLCFADISDDRGRTFRKAPIPAQDDANMIQPSFWQSDNGSIHALMRTDKGFIYRSDSADGGESWCNAYPTVMPNNNSGLDCVKAANGNVYLVCNPVGKNWGAHSPLTLFVSSDDGEHFEKLIDLETEPGEYSYPAIIADKDRLYITYTYKRQKIAFVEIEI